MLQLSILVKNVAQHLWAQYRLCDFAWCFVLLHAFLQLFCMTRCQVSGIMWSSETVPEDAHTKFILVLRL